MDYFEPFIDLRRPESDPQMFVIALALRHIRRLMQHGGSDRGRPDDESAIHPHHLEAFLARAVATTWHDQHAAQEWCRL